MVAKGREGNHPLLRLYHLLKEEDLVGEEIKDIMPRVRENLIP